MLGFRARIGSVLVVMLTVALVPTVADAAAPRLDRVTFTVYACPASIQTPDDLANAGGPFEACAVAGRTGDFGFLFPGFHWRTDPIEYDLQASLRGRGRPLTNPEATAGGTCDPDILECTAFQAYGWFNTPAGRFKLALATLPTGFGVGWANVYVDGQATTVAVDAASQSVTVDPPNGSTSVYVEFINLAN
jgi:hypothetical protein